MLLRKPSSKLLARHADIAKQISELVEKELALEAMGRDEYVPSVEHIQDLVEKYIMAVGYLMLLRSTSSIVMSMRRYAPRKRRPLRN